MECGQCAGLCGSHLSNFCFLVTHNYNNNSPQTSATGGSWDISCVFSHREQVMTVLGK
jgi:hypothetical protein